MNEYRIYMSTIGLPHVARTTGRHTQQQSRESAGTASAKHRPGHPFVSISACSWLHAQHPPALARRVEEAELGHDALEAERRHCRRDDLRVVVAAHTELSLQRGDNVE